MPLVEGESEIPASEELLYRQVTDLHFNETLNIPTSMAFSPMPIDQGKPSFARSTAVTAQDSRDWHNKKANRPSLAVWACSAREVTERETRAIDDSGLPPDPNRSPGHCYVDYRHMNAETKRTVRALLLADALARGEITTSTAPE